MRFLLALVLVGLLGRTAFADIETETGAIEGYAVDVVFEPLAGVSVRIVGAAIVMTVHADPSGAIHVTGLPPGRYRIEVEGGGFSHRPIVHERPLTIDRATMSRPGTYYDRFVHCCICAMRRNEDHVNAIRAATPAPTPLIDTHSTSVGIRLGQRELLGH